MEIKWFGHSNFELFSNDTRIWIDPFFTGNPFAGDWKKNTSPDLLLITHDHADHFGDALNILENSSAKVLAIADICYDLPAQGVSTDKILFGGNGMNIGGTVEFNGFKITMTHALHSCKLGVATGYVIQDPKGFTVYHAGDTGIFGDMCLLAERFNIDVALLPIGGHFTMDAIDAAKACEYLEASSVIPMHYATFPVLAQNTIEFQDALKTYAAKTKFIPLEANKSISL
jgi:L-ascorbate metabolism protein UlaG (beta-lactamase superfamily)